MLKIIILAILLFILVFIPSISLAIEEDPLKDMDISFPIEKKDISENVVNPFSIGGYLESRNQLRAKDVDEPISLRQRLWLDCYFGRDWIRGFASAYFDYDPAVRDWTDDIDELYYVELNEAYLTIDGERIIETPLQVPGLMPDFPSCWRMEYFCLGLSLWKGY
jgi:hypothetical protein